MLTNTLTAKAVQLRNLSRPSATSQFLQQPRRHPPLHLQQPPPPPPRQLHRSHMPSATRKLTSILLEITTPTETAEADLTTEGNAAAVDQEATASPTPRQREALPTLNNRRPHHLFVVGTKSLEIKASNARPIALISNPINPSCSSRETPTGAGVSERGDPLFIINNKK